MGVGVLIIYIFGLIILILSPVAYFGLKKTGHKKAGIVIALLLALIVVIPAFSMIFESELYWKSDAIEDLDKIGIVLIDDFEILENEIIGNPEYYQTTELLISSKDRDRIIKKIKSSNNYKLMDVKKSLSSQVNRNVNIKEIWNYKFDNSYVRESIEIKDEYVPVEITVKLRKNSDTLGLSVIMD
jgi:predicted PurR-regulated permease PerM